MKILITGTAGFIGYHLTQRLMADGHTVHGMDNLNDYYDISLKYARLNRCGILPPSGYGSEVVSGLNSNYIFHYLDLTDYCGLEALFSSHQFDVVVNLAAQAGVRYSLSHPESYIQSNLAGFSNLLEVCRKSGCRKLIYASSSSVYGNDTPTPFREDARTDHPVSMYAATKKSNELMAYTYSHLYKIPTIGLRFFTVYGPYGRPDMAPMLFARAIQAGEEIQVFNRGDLSRDFTYIDDIVTGIERIITTPGIKREDTAGIPATLYNIGRGKPVQLMTFIQILEKAMGKPARKKMLPMQAGDVFTTWADTGRMREDYQYAPGISIEDGINRMADWLKSYYE